MAERWRPDEVLALAPDAAARSAGRAVADPGGWSAAGSDDEAVWGLCVGRGREPYQTVVDLAATPGRGPAFRCSCPSRKVPCKHALGLLLLWADGQVATARRPGYAAQWLAHQAMAAQAAAAAAAREADRDGATATSGPARTTNLPAGGPPPGPGPDPRQVERDARVRAGLDELDRWLADQVRGGLTAPELARYSTWDAVAARLVDAQAPSLANRVRRLGGIVGARATDGGTSWHERVLEEVGVLHLLAVAGRRLPELSGDLADGVRQALGWSVPRERVLASPPLCETWHVAGRSDTAEDRLTVRRTWLWGATSRRWVLVLSFGAFGRPVDEWPPVGTTIAADVHLYPARLGLRGLIGEVSSGPFPDGVGPPTTTIVEAFGHRGDALAAEPWLERWPVCVQALPARRGGRWFLTDATGAVPLSSGQGAPGVDAPSPRRADATGTRWRSRAGSGPAGGSGWVDGSGWLDGSGLARLLAVSGGRPVAVMGELVGDGLLALTVQVEGRSVAL